MILTLMSSQDPLTVLVCGCLMQESAYPGFGARLDMRGHDHISLCKPEGRDAPAYQVVANMLRDVLTETRASAKASAAENTSP
jgi:hypothetical protein